MSSTSLPKTSSADWDSTASQYTSIVEASNFMTVFLQKMFKLMDTSETPFNTATSILDLGCGPGTATSSLLHTYSDILPSDTRFIAGDYSPGMISQVSQLRNAKLHNPEIPNQEREFWSRMTPLVLDATNLSPLPDSGFSHVIASLVFFLTEDPVAAVRETFRVLAPNGVLGCTSWAQTSWLAYMAEAARRTLPLHKSVPEEPKLPIEWSSLDAVRSQLQNAGFRDVRVEYVDTAMLVQDPETWTKRFVSSKNPGVVWVTQHLNDEEMRELERQFAIVVREKCEKGEDGAFRLVGTAVVAVGVK